MEIEAMETLFISGQMKESLDASREWLKDQLHLNAEVITANTNLSLLGKEVHVAIHDAATVLDDESERALAIYMQSAFELNVPGETLLLADALRILSPVPYHVGLYWGSFLSAMGHTMHAQEFFTRTLAVLEEHLHATTDAAIVSRQYDEMFAALVTKVWLADPASSSTNLHALVRVVENNAVLTGASKSCLVDLIQQHNVEQAPPPPAAPSPASQPPRAPLRGGPRAIAPLKQTTASSFLADPSTPLILGAAAVAAVCAIKYRSQLHSSLGDVMSTLQEAKGLFFG